MFGYCVRSLPYERCRHLCLPVYYWIEITTMILMTIIQCCRFIICSVCYQRSEPSDVCLFHRRVIDSWMKQRWRLFDICADCLSHREGGTSTYRINPEILFQNRSVIKRKYIAPTILKHRTSLWVICEWKRFARAAVMVLEIATKIHWTRAKGLQKRQSKKSPQKFVHWMNEFADFCFWKTAKCFYYVHVWRIILSW